MKQDNFKIDFIGIGDQKSATTWIFQCLKEHPELCLYRNKETRFFESDNLYKKGIDFYKSLFTHCGIEKIIGEFSPSYIHYPKVPYRIKKYFPNVKLIVCLRNPIEKLYSGYWFDKTGGTGSTSIYKNFEDAIDKCPGFVQRNFYYKKLEDYFNIFPKENILVLIYEEIQKDSLKFIQEIYQFLGVKKDFIPLSADRRVNITGAKRLRFPVLNWIVFKTYRFLEKYSFFKKFIDRIDKKEMTAVLAQMSPKKISRAVERPPMNLKTREYLQEIYRQDIKNLEKLINRDLSLWR
jgi:hypothetical protein